MPTLTPEQQKRYYAEEGQKPTPLAPLDWLKQQRSVTDGSRTLPEVASPTTERSLPNSQDSPLLKFANTAQEALTLARQKRNKLFMDTMGKEFEPGLLPASSFASVLSNLNKASSNFVATDPYVQGMKDTALAQLQPNTYQTLSDANGAVYQVETDATGKIVGTPQMVFGGKAAAGGGGTPSNGLVDSTGKPISLTATQVDTLSGYDNTTQASQEAISLIDKGVSTGPFAGNFLQAAKLIGNADEDQLRLEQLLGKIKADFMKALSGAAVSEQEQVRLSKFLPDITDQETVIKSKLNTLIEEVNRSRTNYLKALGVEVSTATSDVSFTGKTSSGLEYTVEE